jgi:hypothetical protein
VFQPFLEHARDALPSAPLWNPFVGIGRPFLANAQSAIFSPFSWPSFALPFWWSLGLVAALKVWVAAFGGYMLGRALGMRFGGALLTGLAYGLAPFFVVWIAWPLTSVWAWLPWLLLATDMVVRRPGALAGAGLATAVALQFSGGHPESSFHVLAAALAFLAVRVWARRADTGVVRPLAVFGVAVAAGAAVVAAAVVPFVELLVHSGDVSARSGESVHVDAKFAFTLLLSDYWGRPTATNLEGFAVQKALYVGALPLILALVALGRPSRERIGVAAIAGIAIAVVLGLPPIFEAVTALPGFSTVHNTRLTVVFALAVALLAGWGLDELSGDGARRSSRRAVFVAVALLALPLLFMAGAGRLDAAYLGEALRVAWAFATPPLDEPAATPVVQQAALIVWVTVAGAALGLLGLRSRGRIAAVPFVALVLVLTAGDLFRAGMGQNPAIEREHAEQPVTGALRALREGGLERFAGIQPVHGFVPLPPDLAMRYGLYDARGYDYPIERRYQDLWRRWISPTETFVPFTTVVPVTPASLRVLGMLGVSRLLQEPADPPLREPGVRLVYAGRDGRVYRNRHALPRAFLVGAQRPVTGERAALEAIGQHTAELGRVAVVERPLPGIPRVRDGVPPPSSPGTAAIESYEDERVSVATRARRPAVLVLSDLHYPGWKATLDGESADLERVNHLLRGVRVPAGAHSVEFRYQPWSWRLGWILSVLSLGAVAMAAAIGWRRR